MSKPANISTYDELELRKKELDLEVEVSQRELAHSLGTSRVNLNDFLLKKIALPIGGAVAGVWLLSKFTGRKNRHTHTIHETKIVEKAQSDGDQAKNHYPVPPPRPPKQERDHGYVSQRPRSAAAQMAVTNEDGEAELRSQPKKNEVMAPKNKKHLINMATIASVAKIALPAVKMIFKHVSDYKEQRAGSQLTTGGEAATSDARLASGVAAAAGTPRTPVGHS